MIKVLDCSSEFHERSPKIIHCLNSMVVDFYTYASQARDMANFVVFSEGFSSLKDMENLGEMANLVL